MTAIALVDDHRLFSASMAIALRAEGFDVDVPPLVSLEAVRERLTATGSGVVILDRDLGTLGSGEVLIEPLAQAGSSVVVVSATLDDVVVGRCLARGATVCVPKSDPFDALLAVVVSVAVGEPPLAATERFRLIDCWRRWQARADAAHAPFAQLTPREAIVLGKLMDGRSVKAIARESYVSEATVRTQVRGILTKLSASSQLEAVALALRSGWRPPAPPASIDTGHAS